MEEIAAVFGGDAVHGATVAGSAVSGAGVGAGIAGAKKGAKVGAILGPKGMLGGAILGGAIAYAAFEIGSRLP